MRRGEWRVVDGARAGPPSALCPRRTAPPAGPREGSRAADGPAGARAAQRGGCGATVGRGPRWAPRPPPSLSGRAGERTGSVGKTKSPLRPGVWLRGNARRRKPRGGRRALAGPAHRRSSTPNRAPSPPEGATPTDCACGRTGVGPRDSSPGHHSLETCPPGCDGRGGLVFVGGGGPAPFPRRGGVREGGRAIGSRTTLALSVHECVVGPFQKLRVGTPVCISSSGTTHRRLEDNLRCESPGRRLGVGVSVPRERDVVPRGAAQGRGISSTLTPSAPTPL